MTYYYTICEKAGVEYKETYRVNSILGAIDEFNKDYGVEGYELILVAKCK
jgi:hypothetical protein